MALINKQEQSQPDDQPVSYGCQILFKFSHNFGYRAAFNEDKLDVYLKDQPRSLRSNVVSV
ncbi:MAG: hypothetical protein ACRC9R_03945 [Enterovibrio sp.]